MTLNIGYSSEIYEVDPADLIILKDCQQEQTKGIHADEEIVVLIGNQNIGTIDTLVKGRDAVKKALNNGIEYVPVRFAFISKIPAWNLLPVFIKKFRYQYKYFNSHIYHVSALKLRELGLERGRRTAENAYAITNKRWVIPEEERLEKYNSLVASLQEGFNDKFPISIMLCRRAGSKDCIDNGHHRMGICIEQGIDRISTNFIAAGKAPHVFQKIYLYLTKG